jgi:hypothetical protein
VAAKSGGQEVWVGEVFVKCAEKTGFPGFGFFRQGNNYALRGRRRLSRRKKCNSADQRKAAGRMGFGSVMAMPDTYPIQKFISEYLIGGDGPMLPSQRLAWTSGCRSLARCHCWRSRVLGGCIT